MQGFQDVRERAAARAPGDTRLARTRLLATGVAWAWTSWARIRSGQAGRLSRTNRALAGVAGEEPGRARRGHRWNRFGRLEDHALARCSWRS